MSPQSGHVATWGMRVQWKLQGNRSTVVQVYEGRACASEYAEQSAEYDSLLIISAPSVTAPHSLIPYHPYGAHEGAWGHPRPTPFVGPQAVPRRPRAFSNTFHGANSLSMYISRHDYHSFDKKDRPHLTNLNQLISGSHAFISCAKQPHPQPTPSIRKIGDIVPTMNRWAVPCCSWTRRCCMP